LIFFFVRNVNRNWSKASQGSYGKASDGTIDAHFDLIPQIVRKSPTQIDGMSLTSDSGALPAHSDMTTGYYHQQPVLLQYGYLSDEQYAHVTQLDHENILKCIGFAPSRQQLVFEHAPHGTLPTVVGYHRFDIVAIVKILRDISSGMRLLHAHSFVHRNLTSYNIFVGSDFTPKIAKYLSNDFRPDYRRSALEVWENQPYTPATDVYSFGILMWEIFQIFSQADPEPFRGFSETEVLEQLRSGRNLPRPGDCPEQAYKLMEACWAYRPSNRPNFIQIYVELENILNQMENCVAV
jgi:serine/threonine protein kinase